MDWIPTPGKAAPGIEVPLLGLVPIPARRARAGRAAPHHDDDSWFVSRASWRGVHYQCSMAAGLDAEKLLEKVRKNKDRFPHPETSSRAVWKELPYRYGFTSSSSNDEVLATEQPVRFAAFLQSWGFFGLIGMVLNHEVHRADWKRACDPSGRYLAVKWPSALQEKLSGSKWCIGKQEDLELVYAVMRICHAVECSSMATITPIAEICLSTRLLCERLRLHDGQLEHINLVDFANGLWEQEHALFNELDIARRVERALFEARQARSPFLMQAMIQRGWCPSIAGRFMDVPLLGLLLTYYLFTLETGRNKDGKSHSACTECVCKAHNVSLDDKYETRHVTPHCQCDMVGVDANEVSKIIARGQVPVIEFIDTPNEPKLSLREARTSDEYTAISHVWTDGLGNPVRNALPRCQLSRLNEEFDRLADARLLIWDMETWLGFDGIASIIPGRFEIDLGKWQVMIRTRKSKSRRLFWMDTLCIPVGEGDELRKRKLEAIERMNYIYAAANKVLVLDSELLTTNLCASGKLETYARIAISPWLRRSWTFQEGALANYLHFDCADSSLNMTIEAEDAWDRAELSARQRLGQHDFEYGDSSKHDDELSLEGRFFRQFDWLINRPLRLYKAQLSEASDGADVVRLERFAATWNELSRRTTTMSADVYLIFANILGYSPTTIAHLPHEQRMQAIIWSMRLLPIGLLYNDGPRAGSTTDTRNRWVPMAPGKKTIAREQVYYHEDTLWSDRMVLRDNSLWIQAESAPSTVLLLFDQHIGRKEKIRVRGLNGSECEITAHVGSEDQFSVPPNSTMCILMDLSGKGNTIAGARVYITQRTSSRFDPDSLMGYDPTVLHWPSADVNDFVDEKPLRGTHTRMTAVYDCPVSIDIEGTASESSKGKEVKHATLAETPSAILQYPQVAWKLEIVCEPPSNRGPLIERPTLRGVVPVSIAGILFCWSFFWMYPWALISYSLRLAIAINLGWHGMTALYKASLILWILMPLPPLPETLFIADRISLHAVRPIDVAWVVLSTMLYWITIGGALLGPIIIPLLTHRAWSRAYDKDWPKSASSFLHGMTFGLSRDLSNAVAAGLEVRSGYQTLWNVENKLFKYLVMPLLITRLAVLLVKDPWETVETLSMLRGTKPANMFTGPPKEDSWKHLHDGTRISVCSLCKSFIYMRYYHCDKCQVFDLYKDCVQRGEHCREAGHWLVPRNNHAAIDKRGWLTAGWTTRIGTSGNIEYIEERTGAVSTTRPVPVGMHKRKSKASMRVYGKARKGLCLHAARQDLPTIIWTISGSDETWSVSSHDSDHRPVVSAEDDIESEQ